MKKIHLIFALALLIFSFACKKEKTGPDCPLVSFQADGLSGNATLAVRLTNNTTGAVSYEWNFGDQSPVSTEKNPQHTFNTHGIFNIRLIAASADGCRDTATVMYSTLPLDVRPVACFSTKGTNGLKVPDLVKFVADCSTGALTYRWDFGDTLSNGNTATGKIAYHYFTKTGVYFVKLTAEGPAGSDDITIAVTITTNTFIKKLELSPMVTYGKYAVQKSNGNYAVYYTDDKNYWGGMELDSTGEIVNQLLPVAPCVNSAGQSWFATLQDQNNLQILDDNNAGIFVVASNWNLGVSGPNDAGTGQLLSNMSFSPGQCNQSISGADNFNYHAFYAAGANGYDGTCIYRKTQDSVVSYCLALLHLDENANPVPGSLKTVEEWTGGFFPYLIESFVPCATGGYIAVGHPGYQGIGPSYFWHISTDGAALTRTHFSPGLFKKVISLNNGKYALLVRFTSGFHDDEIWIMNDKGEELNKSTEMYLTVSDMVLSPDGNQIVVVGDGTFRILNVQTLGVISSVSYPAQPDYNWALTSIKPTADGGYILCGSQYRSNPFDYDLFVIRTDALGKIYY